METSFDAIKAALAGLENLAWDDYRYPWMIGLAGTVKVEAIAKVGCHTVVVSTVPRLPSCILRVMYVDNDGMACWGQRSVGGDLEVGKFESIEAAIAHYNETLRWYPGVRLRPVTNLTYL